MSSIINLSMLCCRTQALQGSGYCTKPDRVQEKLGECSQAHGVPWHRQLDGVVCVFIALCQSSVSGCGQRIQNNGYCRGVGGF